MPKSFHVAMPSRSVVSLNTFVLTVYVVSSSSSPSPSTSPSPPARPAVCASPSSCAPSVAGVSARDVAEVASRTVDAGVVAPDDAGGAGAKLKPELGAGVAVCDGAREGEPKEKPMLPALGEGVPSAAGPAATPNTNGGGVAVDVAEPKPPKGEDDGLAGEPNVVAPNTLLGGDALSLSLSLSDSADLAPNILPELVVVSPKSFAPGGMLSENGAEPKGAEADLSFSLSFPSVVDDVSDPKSTDDFGGPPNNDVLELGWLLPKGEALEVVLADADAPNENVDFDGRAESASFDVRNTAGLKAEDEAAVNAPKGDVEAAGAGLVSEGAGGNLKREEPVTDAAGLGVKPVPGAAELAVAGGALPEKLDGGTGIVAEVEVVDLSKENGAAKLTGLGALGAFRAVDCEAFPSYSRCTDIRWFLYCSNSSTTSMKGSDSMAFEIVERKDVLSPRREV